MSGAVTEEMISRIQAGSFRDRFLLESRTVQAYSSKLAGGAPRVLDFGCGQGIGALGVAMHVPHAQVEGVDLSASFNILPQECQKNLGVDVPGNLSLQTFDGETLPFQDARFDLIYSWSVFEHVRRDLLPLVLAEIRRVMKPDGHLFIQIDPLYFSSRGAHLYGVCPTPWVHLLLQHDVLRQAVDVADSPKASRDYLWQQYESLNRITVGELLSVLKASDFTVVKTQVAKSDVPIPEALLEIYQREVLQTSTVYLLAHATT